MPKLRTISLEILSLYETRVYLHHISGSTSDALAPLIGSRPGQLPGWPVRYFGLVRKIVQIEALLTQTLMKVSG